VSAEITYEDIRAAARRRAGAREVTVEPSAVLDGGAYVVVDERGGDWYAVNLSREEVVELRDAIDRVLGADGSVLVANAAR
jgi:hypothetical protein